MSGYLGEELSERTDIFGLKLWVVTGICVGAFIVLILFLLVLWLSSRSKSRSISEKAPSIMIPMVSKEIKEVNADIMGDNLSLPYGRVMSMSENSDADKQIPHSGSDVEMVKRSWKLVGDDGSSEAGGYFMAVDKVMVEGERKGLLGSSMGDALSIASGDSRLGEFTQQSSTVPQVLHLGWGHWYTLRDLELATNFFSPGNVLGEGGYGIVYRGQLPDGSFIAVKNLLNNSRGQAEKEFKVEVEAIGRVRHKNLVRLIGYCAEGSHRMLVYEFVDNGNLDQWLHGKLGEEKTIPWEGRMKIILGTAKGLAYLHEGLEPKVVHRDVKSSNILLDTQWNAKVSDFGLAKLLGAGKSFVTTRVMGTFGYVAPEYANTGLLNERSDVYSFGVLLMEVITGRDPVDYGRPTGEVNLVDWLKTMVGNRQSEEVVGPRLEVRPSSRALKRALLVALRCVDPDAHKRPKMGHVVHMLEADEYPYRDERKSLRMRNSPHHHQLQVLQAKEGFQDSPGRIRYSSVHRVINEDQLELVLESPSGPGYKPSLRSPKRGVI